MCSSLSTPRSFSGRNAKENEEVRIGGGSVAPGGSTLLAAVTFAQHCALPCAQKVQRCRRADKSIGKLSSQVPRENGD